jgi:hypothetical protein
MDSAPRRLGMCAYYHGMDRPQHNQNRRCDFSSRRTKKTTAFTVGALTLSRRKQNVVGIDLGTQALSQVTSS